MRAFLIAAVLSSIVACGDDAADLPDAGGTPATVWEHLVADGEWIQDFRLRDFDCTGCRTVARFELVPDEECGCVALIVHLYWDVVATDDAMGLDDGDEYCTQRFELNEVMVEGVDPAVRSFVEGPFTETTCPGAVAGGLLVLLLDAQQVDEDGRPGLIALVQPGAPDPYFHVAGYPDDDLVDVAVPLVRCADADRVAGRDYCMPSCDWPGADAGRPACGFPDYEDPQVYDLACQADALPTTAADPVAITGGINEFPGGAMVAGASVELRGSADDALIDADTTSASGSFSLSAATGGAPLDGYYHVSASGYLDTYMQHAGAVVAPYQAFATLYTPAVSQAFLDQVGATADPTKGTMVIRVLDCEGAVTVSGATISIDPAPAGLAYLDEDGAPDPTLTATGRASLAVAWGVPPGASTVTVHVGDAVYRARPAVPVVANAVTSVDRAP